MAKKCCWSRVPFFLSSKYGVALIQELEAKGFDVAQCSVPMEPTPSLVDEAVRRYASFHCDVVVAIGGGSVLDAGKAISAMLPLNEPVKDFLEGVGTKPHPVSKFLSSLFPLHLERVVRRRRMRSFRSQETTGIRNLFVITILFRI